MTNDSRVRQAISDWQDRLLQLDQRNRLLYFNPNSPSVVELTVDGMDDFLDRLENSRHGLAFPFQPAETRQASGRFADQLALHDPSPQSTTGPRVEPGDISTSVPVRQLQTRLLRLRNRDREFREEQGLNVLFLACGMLHWVDENDVEALAPLLLVPCTLDRASPRDPFFLRRNEDEALANITLEHKLGVDLRFDLPDFAAYESAEAYLEAVEGTSKGKPGWSVTRDLHLGTFQYSKMAMWEDLEELRSADQIDHSLVRFLAGDADVSSDDTVSGAEWFLRAEEELEGARLDDEVRPQDNLLIMSADFSQLQVIGAARTGRNLVVHGPPGTGKSQTIANLIGAFISEGKSVLFVSEKTAALDVVKRRLDECGLGIFCLDLHSERGRKANVYAQFREALASERSTAADAFDYDGLLAIRDQLNTYVREIHERRPLGLSVYQVSGLFAQVQDLPDVPFPVMEPLSLTTDSLGAITEVTHRLSARPQEFAEHFTSRWLALKEEPPSLGFADDLRRRLEPLVIATSNLGDLGQAVAGWFGIGIPSNTAETRVLIEMLALMEQCPGIGASWLDPKTCRELFELARHQLDIQESRGVQLREFERFFQRYPSQTPGLADAAMEAREIFADAGQLSRLGNDWPSRVLKERPDLTAALREIGGLFEEIEATGEPLRSSLGLTGDLSTVSLRDLVALGEDLATLGTVPESWLTSDLQRTVLPSPKCADTFKRPCFR